MGGPQVRLPNVICHATSCVAHLTLHGCAAAAVVGHSSRSICTQLARRALCREPLSLHAVPAGHRRWLQEPTWEGEAALWKGVCDSCRVILTPGKPCHAPAPGFFRLCFAWVPRQALADAVGRLGAHLRTLEAADTGVSSGKK